MKTYADSNAVIMLVGNKCDFESPREVTTQEGLDFANRNAMSFYETSAKESINVDTIFTKLLTGVSVHVCVRACVCVCVCMRVCVCMGALIVCVCVCVFAWVH